MAEMGESQMETLKYSNHWQLLSSQLWEFAGRQTYTDLKLVCCDGQLEAHSPIFFSLLNNFNVEISDQIDDKTLVLPDVSCHEMLEQLRLLYTSGTSDVLFKFLTGYNINQRKSNVKAESKDLFNNYKSGAGQNDITVEDMMNVSLVVKEVKEETEQGGVSNTVGHISPTEMTDCDWLGHNDDLDEYKETNEESYYSCLNIECGKVFISKTLLKRHAEKYHPTEMESSQHKKVKQKSKSSSKQKESEFHCNMCGKKFTRKDHLKRHAITHTGEKPFSCEFCGSRFTRADALVQHKMGCQTKNETPSEVLKVVGKSEGKTLDKLSNVLFGKVVDYIWGCKVCYQVFESESDLNKHRQVAHSDGTQFGKFWNPSVNKYTCPVCEKVLKTKHLIWFIYHMEKCKRGEGACLPGEMDSFLCHICSKPFTSKQTLNMHVNYVHTNDRPFKCSMCHKSYKIKSELSQHEMTHSDHFNYSCETCGKQFRGKVNLRMHMKTHLSDDEKKHICSMCGHRFARLQHLRNHLTTHSSIGTFPCDICGTKSKTMDALRQHKKSHRSVAGMDKNFPQNPPGRPTAADKVHMETERAMMAKNMINMMDQKMPFSKSSHVEGMKIENQPGIDGLGLTRGGMENNGSLDHQRNILSKLEMMESQNGGHDTHRQLLSRLGGAIDGMEAHHPVDHLALMRNYKLYNS